MPRGNSTPETRARAAADSASKVMTSYLRATRPGASPLDKALARVRESGRYDVILREGFTEGSDVDPADVQLAFAQINVALRRGAAADLAPVYEGDLPVSTVADALNDAVAREAKVRRGDVPVDVIRLVWPEYQPESQPVEPESLDSEEI